MIETVLEPKVAYIEVRHSVEDFLAEWDDTDGEVPTQSDYEDWLIATVMGNLENRKWWPQIHLRNP
jgi:hypothetical protein